MADGTYQSVKVEIENIKEDIKEIKLDQKETNQYYREVIGELKENLLVQTKLLSVHDQQFNDVKKDITDLKDKIDTTIENQKVDIMTVLKYLATGIFGLVLGYIGVKLGIK